MFISASSIQPWNSPFPALTFASKSKTQIEINQIHANLITTGHINKTSIMSKIIIELAFHNQKAPLEFAKHLFSQNCYRDRFIWNAIISSSISNGNEPEAAFQLFVVMLVRGVMVDAYSISLMLKYCSKFRFLDIGMQIHGFMLKFDFESDVFIQNGLICMYIKCGVIQLGRQVFDRMLEKDSYSFNLMIDGYVKCGMVSLARELFDTMPIDTKNLVSWNTIINGYTKLENGFNAAWDLFSKMPERDLISWNLMIDCCAKNGEMGIAEGLFNKMCERDVVSWASMVDGYAKVGNIESARRFFDDMPQRDVISCNAMMAGYVNNGLTQEALKVFHDMVNGNGYNLVPDIVTLLIALSATTKLGCINEGIAIHNYIHKHGFVVTGKLGVALVDMYAKCGSIEDSINVFDSIKEKNIDHWNAMIGGFAVHGLGDLAFGLLMEMKRLSVKPDDITFIAVLHACGHSGMVKEGLICFEIMRSSYKIVPKLQHYGCIVDILCRAGFVEVAKNIVEEMRIQPNSIIWRTLLCACTNCENLNLGEPVAKHLIGMDLKDSSSYVLLSNMYAQLGMWDDVRKVRTMMKDREISKVPGCSWIEVDGTVHEFFVESICNHQ